MENEIRCESDSILQNTQLSSSEAFDILLEHVRPSGQWQIRLFLIGSFCGFFIGIQSFASAFLSTTPRHWCANEELSNRSLPARNSFIEWPHINRFYDQFLRCHYYDIDYQAVLATWKPNNTLQDVTHDAPVPSQCSSWQYDTSEYTSTVVSEWDLVCERRWMKTSTQSVYMAGVLFGGLILSELSDVYGRRPVVLVSTVGFFVSNVACAFAPSFTAYLIIRFLIAFFAYGLYLPIFVIIMEVTGPKARSAMGLMYQAFFGVGICVLPGVAFYIRDWRTLQMVLSFPSVVLLVYFWQIPESPRWLLHQGREEEALKVLRAGAKINKGRLPPEPKLKYLISCIIETKPRSTSILTKMGHFFKSQVKLVRTPILRRRCLIMFFAWFTVSMVYYGLSFSSDNIEASVYLLIFLSGIVEIPAYFLTLLTLQRYGRRWNLCFTFLFSGISCLLILAVPRSMIWLNVTLASFGKLCISVAFAVGYIYSTELVPTEIRNISIGTCSVYARIGSTMAPFIVDQLGEVHYAIPSTVFGILSIMVAGCTLLLPETGNQRLPETIEEVEGQKK